MFVAGAGALKYGSFLRTTPFALQQQKNVVSVTVLFLGLAAIAPCCSSYAAYGTVLSPPARNVVPQPLHHVHVVRLG